MQAPDVTQNTTHRKKIICEKKMFSFEIRRELPPQNFGADSF